MAHLVAACVVHQILPDPGTVGTTAIDKRPVEGGVKVGPYGLYADVQADRKFHGGHEKAVYLYGEDDAAHWSAELGRELPPGWFGENLRVAGLDPTTARVGERWRVGSGPDAVEIELTGPRTPCQTFARWVGGDDTRGWVKRFTAEGRVGAYARVVKTGKVSALDPIEVVSRPEAPTILDVFRRQ